MAKTFGVKTKRLIITPMTDAEMEALAAAETDAHMKNAYLEMLEGARSHAKARIWYTAWRIALKDGTPVGDLCFKGPQREGEVEIGYGISDAHKGAGYATEAVKAMTDWALGHEGVWFVVAQTEPDNAASQRVLEKCGFARDGEGDEGPRFTKEKPKPSNMTVFMCCGMSMGLAIGLSLNGMVTGMCIGLCLGLCFGTYLDKNAEKEREKCRAARNARRAA